MAHFTIIALRSLLILRITRCRVFSLLLGALLVTSPTSFAQFRIDTWTTENGLPQNSVNAIVQTRDGYLWLGTFGGLVRFDGIRFSVFDRSNSPGLISDRILHLLEDESGVLWIGTEGDGLIRYEGGRFTPYRSHARLTGAIVTKLFIDHSGALWVGTSGQGLFQIQNGIVQHVFDTGSGLSSDVIYGLAEDSDGNLLVGLPAGFQKIRSSVVAPGPRAVAGGVTSFYTRKDNSVWIGTGPWLAEWKRGTLKHIRPPKGTSELRATVMHEDHDGAIWVGTFKNGVFRIKGSSTEAFTTRDGLTMNQISSLCVDREGTLWIGTNGGGLNRLRFVPFKVLTTEHGLSNNVILSISQGREGGLWVGTNCGGLNYLKDGAARVFTMANGLSNDCVWSAIEDRTGGVWVGTWGGGANYIRNGVVRIYKKEQGFLQNNVLALLQDSRGAIWFGTSDGGVNVLQQGHLTVLTTRNGLVHDDVRTFFEDRDGSMWIGTRGGLSHFKNGLFTNYTSQNGLPNDYVRAIHRDAEGYLWIGTYGGGLSLFRDGSFVTVDTRSGLFDNIVSTILEDSFGSLWMSCNRGIYRVPKEDLHAFVEGKRNSIRSFSYGVEDGLKSVECNGGFYPAGCNLEDGRLAFPTIKGIALVDPANVSMNEYPPPVVLEELVVDERGIPLEPGVELSHESHRFEFHYTALSFVAPRKVAFKYRLDGFDKDWVDAGNSRVAYYTGLQPGEYHFRAIAANNDGVWNEVGTSFAFVVLTPFWMTWWFQSLMVLNVVGVAVGFYRFRIRQLELQQATERAYAGRVAESEKKFRTLFEESKDAVFMSTRDGKMLDINPAGVALFGYSSKEEFLKVNIGTDLYADPEDRSRYQETIEEKSFVKDYELLLKRKDGQILRTLITSTVVRNKQGAIIGYRGTIRDITEQKKIEMALQESEARYRSLVESAPDVIYTLSAEGALTSLNPAFESVTGWSRSECIGRHFSAIVFPEDLPLAYGVFQRGLQGFRSSNYEIRIVSKSGEIVTGEFVSAPRVKDGKVVGILGIARDITDRKRSEELRLAKEAAEETSRAKSQFLTTVSHELRTPLSSVIGFANVLLKNKEKNLTETDLLYLSKILENGIHLLGLINNILDLSKIESGKMEVSIAPVYVDTLIRATIEQVGVNRRGKDLKVKTDIPPSLAHLETDEAKLRQVLINLIGNAMKFTEKGIVTVRVAAHPVTRRPVRIDVVDTGIGIPEERLQNVFEAFQQADGTTARKYGGTGLGLTICRSLCDLLGFKLTASSIVGKGSTFSVIMADSVEEKSFRAPSLF